MISDTQVRNRAECKHDLTWKIEKIEAIEIRLRGQSWNERHVGEIAMTKTLQFWDGFYQKSLECNLLTMQSQHVHKLWRIARHKIGQPASSPHPAIELMTSKNVAFHAHLIQPFSTTLYNDLNIFFDTMVFAHKNSNAIFPIPLEQCWTAWWMRENTHIVIKYRQQGSNLLDKLHEHKWFDGSLLQENLQLQRDNQKLQKMPWLMPLKWNNKLNYGKDSAMATRAQGSRIISIQTHA